MLEVILKIGLFIAGFIFGSLISENSALKKRLSSYEKSPEDKKEG
jgi:hypothetical protein